MERITIVLLMLLTIALPAPALLQVTDTANLQPQYRDQYVGVVNGQPLPLERVHKSLSTEHRRIFVITPSDRIFDSIPNASSPVRLPADAHFLIRMETGGRDPLTLIHLQPLKSTKKDREVTKTTIKASIIPFGGVHENHASDTTLALSVKDRGNGTLEIIPTMPLPPGEYAFIAGVEAQCFGVDANSASAASTSIPAPSMPASPPAPPKPATWKIEQVPEISTAGQDVQQSTAGLMGRDVIEGKHTDAYLSMHCGFPATEFPELLPLEVVLGGTDEMFDSPALPGAWVDISAFAYSSIGTGQPFRVSAVAQNRTTGARVRFFYEAPDMQAVVDAAGQVLTVSLQNGQPGSKGVVSAQFHLPADSKPLKQIMSSCLEKKVHQAAAMQASVVAACPAAPTGSVLDTVLIYSGTGQVVKGSFSDQDASASWKLTAPIAGKARHAITMNCAYRVQSESPGTFANVKIAVPVPATARACMFHVHQNELRSAAVCTSIPLNATDRPKVVSPIPPV